MASANPSAQDPCRERFIVRVYGQSHGHLQITETSEANSEAAAVVFGRAFAERNCGVVVSKEVLDETGNRHVSVTHSFGSVPKLSGG